MNASSPRINSCVMSCSSTEGSGLKIVIEGRFWEEEEEGGIFRWSLKTRAAAHKNHEMESTVQMTQMISMGKNISMGENIRKRKRLRTNSAPVGQARTKPLNGPLSRRLDRVPGTPVEFLPGVCRIKKMGFFFEISRLTPDS